MVFSRTIFISISCLMIGVWRMRRTRRVWLGTRNLPRRRTRRKTTLVFRDSETARKRVIFARTSTPFSILFCSLPSSVSSWPSLKNRTSPLSAVPRIAQFLYLTVILVYQWTSMAKVTVYLDDDVWSKFRASVFEKHGSLKVLSKQVELSLKQTPRG